MCHVSILTLFLFFFKVNSRQQWYLTGKNFNDNRNQSIYSSEVINPWLISSLHLSSEDSIPFSHSSFGGVIAIYLGNNKTIENEIEKLLVEILNVSMKSFSYKIEIKNVWVYDLFVSVTQQSPLQYEIGLYDHSTLVFHLFYL